MANTREDFGQTIVKARQEQKLSQELLAEKAKITRNNLSRIERGLYNPGQDILFRIADALGKELKMI